MLVWRVVKGLPWRRPGNSLEGFEPDLAVAQGAAIYGQHRRRSVT